MRKNPLEKSKTQVIGDWKRMKFKLPFFLTGFTLVELLIAIAIVGIITTIMVVNFWREGQRGELRQAAEVLASNLRKVQNMGMTGQSLGGSVPAGGFGIYFDKAGPAEYKLFGDKVADGKYVSADDELLDGGTVSLFTGRRAKVEVYKLSTTRTDTACDGTTGGDKSKLHITFKPPKPTPYVCGQDSAGQSQTVEIILGQFRQLTLVQCYKVTVIGASGQISSERVNCP